MTDDLPTCQELHMEATGSGPPVAMKETKIDWLDLRVRTWKEPTSPYDSVVYSLIHETLREQGR